MNIIQQNKQAAISSIELVDIINELRPEGRAVLQHKHLMVKIREVLGEGQTNFRHTYTHGQNGQEYPYYLLPKREASLIVMSESYPVQAKVYDRMTELEAEVEQSLPKDYLSALKALVQSEEIKVEALKQVEVMTPKAYFHDQVAASSGDPLAKFAKVMKIGRNRFFAMLRRDGYLDVNNMPYQKYIDQGLFEVRESNPWVDGNGAKHVNYQTLLTGKGQIYFTKKYFPQS